MSNEFQDIMPLEEISIDYSIYFIYVEVFLLVLVLIYLYVKFLSKKKPVQLTQKEISIKKLKDLNLDRVDTKKLLYEFTLLSKACVREKEKLDLVLEEIEPLKYKKEEFELDTKTKGLLQRYIDDY